MTSCDLSTWTLQLLHILHRLHQNC